MKYIEIDYYLEPFLICICITFKSVAFAVMTLLPEYYIMLPKYFPLCFLKPVIIKWCVKGIIHFVCYQLNLFFWMLVKYGDMTDLKSGLIIFIGTCGASVRLGFEMSAVTHWSLVISSLYSMS